MGRTSQAAVHAHPHSDWGAHAYLKELPAALKAGLVQESDLDTALVRLTRYGTLSPPPLPTSECVYLGDPLDSRTSSIRSEAPPHSPTPLLPHGGVTVSGRLQMDLGLFDPKAGQHFFGLDVDLIASGEHTTQTEPAIACGVLCFSVGFVCWCISDCRCGHTAHTTDEHKRHALEAAQQAIVLLKNDGGLLPFRRGAKVAVIGPHAHGNEVFMRCAVPHTNTAHGIPLQRTVRC